MRSNQTRQDEAYADEALTISPEQVFFIIVKAREFDGKDACCELKSDSNASDDGMVAVLEDTRDDPVQLELYSFISDLTEDEQIDLVALAWLGRDDNLRWKIGLRCARKRQTHIALCPAARRAIFWACRSWPTISKRGSACSENPARQFELGRL